MTKGLSFFLLFFSLRLLAGEAPEAALSPGAAEVARLMGVAGMVEELGRVAAPERGSQQALALRQEITDAVLAASLDIDGLVAEMDNEWAQARDVRSLLEERRDRRITSNAIATIVIGGGVGVTGELLHLKNEKAGAVVAAIAGGVSALLAAIATRQQKGGEMPLGNTPNMLAKILEQPAEFHSEYPDLVWNYLNSVPPAGGGQETRRAQLIRRWKELGRIGAETTPEGQRKIKLLTSSASQQKALSIDLLSDRAMMLSDVRAQVLLLKRDLGRLMRYLLTLRANGRQIVEPPGDHPSFPE
jgi:hypothetical protein